MGDYEPQRDERGVAKQLWLYLRLSTPPSPIPLSPPLPSVNAPPYDPQRYSHLRPRDDCTCDHCLGATENTQCNVRDYTPNLQPTPWTLNTERGFRRQPQGRESQGSGTSPMTNSGTRNSGKHRIPHRNAPRLSCVPTSVYIWSCAWRMCDCVFVCVFVCVYVCVYGTR